MARKLTIYGTSSARGHTLRMLTGSPADTDAINTVMQVLRQGANVREDILYWDEDTWDEYVWG